MGALTVGEAAAASQAAQAKLEAMEEWRRLGGRRGSSALRMEFLLGPKGELLFSPSDRLYRIRQLEKQIARELLQKKWGRLVSKGSLRDRMEFLRSTDEGHILFPSKHARQKKIEEIQGAMDQKTKHAPSGAWIEALENGRSETLPMGMLLSRAFIRVGEDGKPHRRRTPRYALPWEDENDLMTPREAKHFNFPPSSSAILIDRWRQQHAPPDWSRWC